MQSKIILLTESEVFVKRVGRSVENQVHAFRILRWPAHESRVLLITIVYLTCLIIRWILPQLPNDFAVSIQPIRLTNNSSVHLSSLQINSREKVKFEGKTWT